jgi:UDP-3-O-[3-hydroxymyristoyl] N-acetylglucosamine deacetylase
VDTRRVPFTTKWHFPLGECLPNSTINQTLISKTSLVAPHLLIPTPVMEHQSTIRRPVSIEGLGLHSGEMIRLTVSPAGTDTGILLRASDGTLIPANAEHVVDGHFATTVGAYGVRVRTIEHLMAAAAGLGLDNLLVDVSGEELPGLDGSAKEFVELLDRAGRATLPSRRQYIRVEKPIHVEDGNRWLHVVPSETFRVSYTLDHEHPAIGLQAVTVDVTPDSFTKEIAPARTYGFLKDVGAMRQRGLALGGSLENTVVVGKRTVLNDSLRYVDEFVRHKVLDLIGDLFLLERPILGHVVARNGGHSLNHDLVAAIRKAAEPQWGRRRSKVAVDSMAAVEALSGVAAL